MTKSTLYVGLAALAGMTLSTLVSAAETATPPAATTPPAVSAAPAARTEPSPEEKAVRAKFRSACSADIAKFCPDATSSKEATSDEMKAQRTKMRACLTSHVADVTPDCKTAMADRDAAAAARKN
jgi:phosphate-selective porin